MGSQLLQICPVDLLIWTELYPHRSIGHLFQILLGLIWNAGNGIQDLLDVGLDVICERQGFGKFEFIAIRLLMEETERSQLGRIFWHPAAWSRTIIWCDPYGPSLSIQSPLPGKTNAGIVILATMEPCIPIPDLLHVFSSEAMAGVNHLDQVIHGQPLVLEELGSEIGECLVQMVMSMVGHGENHRDLAEQLQSKKKIFQKTKQCVVVLCGMIIVHENQFLRKFWRFQKHIKQGRNH